MQDKADRYASIKYTLAIAEILYTLLLLLALQLSGMNTALKLAVISITPNEFVRVALYCGTIFALYGILSFGLDLYRSFVVEHHFGLSKEKLSSWVSDYLKSAALGLFVFILLMECFYYFALNYPRSWWWMSALFWTFLTVVIARIFPVVVIPLFFKYKRIADESLRKSVFELAEKMRVKILDVFEIDYSKKSLKANAAFVGMGRSRRVLLTDTLVGGGFTNKEIETVLAHEFAHYRMKHLSKMVLISAAGIFAMFYIFSIMDRGVLKADNISNLGSWLFLFMLFQIVLTPFVNVIHRKMEANADRVALETVRDKAAFISMMEKLSERNLAQRRPPVWAKVFFYDHPPISERIESAQNYTASV
jgi:STE24 endopeptidase